MGAVFASAARAPLTSLASVVEMTGDFTLTLPVMLAVAVATATSRALSYGTINTAKLLRRGRDIDRAAPWRAFGDLKAADAMRPFRAPLAVAGEPDGHGRSAGPDPVPVPGPVTHRSNPQAVFATESLAQTLRQLEAYGRDGLPVLSDDGQHVEGWITNASVLRAVAAELGSSHGQAAGSRASGANGTGPNAADGEPPAPLPGYQVLEVTVRLGSPAAGQRLASIRWPDGSTPVSVLRHRKLQDPHPGVILAAGDRISVLSPATSPASSRKPASSRTTATTAPPP